MDTPSRRGSHGKPVHVSEVLEDRWMARQMLRGADEEGESRRRDLLASDVAAPARRTRVIRALAVTGVLVVAAGMAMPSEALAQTTAQGQALGILFLLGASRSVTQTSAKSQTQKPKPGIAASHEAVARIVGLKQKPPSAKDGTVLARTGTETAVSMPDKVPRPPDFIHAKVLRVASDEGKRRKLDRPIELTNGPHANHN
jgi:hypothetical protein